MESREEGTGSWFVSLFGSILFFHFLNCQLYAMPKKSSREVVCKLTVGIVFLYELQKFRKAITVQLRHICFGEILAKLPQVRTSPNLFDYLLGSCVVFLKVVRIIANKIYPRGATTSSSTNQGTVVFWRETYLEE